MRIALISDIHGHAIALTAVLHDIQTQAIDQIICLGDVATIGVQPQESAAKLKALNCICLMGNHDAALLQPDKALDYQIAPELLPDLQWCANKLTADDTNFLRSFLHLTKVTLGANDSMLCFHASPQANTDLIVDTTPVTELNHYFDGHTAAIMAGGHSHVQMLRQVNGTWIINPGSVGNSFRSVYTPGSTPTLNPWAEYGIVEWQEGAVSVEMRRVYFDLKETRQAIRQSDIPNMDWWLEQYKV
ncbi:MAG: metallophosphoesterase family protein [Chloroflexi bacterium]|nr:metallophosphoesterase family protein [Chloroflexota bacterium]